MMMTIPRAAFGVFALLFTVATINVSRAMAQTVTITPTVCGAGTEKACGTEPLITCGHSFGFDFSVLTQSGGIKYSSTTCGTGYKTIYKDVRTTTAKTSESTASSCGGATTSTVGGGSTGTGLTGTRGSGDVEDSPELCEF